MSGTQQARAPASSMWSRKMDWPEHGIPRAGGRMEESVSPTGNGMLAPVNALTAGASGRDSERRNWRKEGR